MMGTLFFFPCTGVLHEVTHTWGSCSFPNNIPSLRTSHLCTVHLDHKLLPVADAGGRRAVWKGQSPSACPLRGSVVTQLLSSLALQLTLGGESVCRTTAAGPTLTCVLVETSRNYHPPPACSFSTSSTTSCLTPTPASSLPSPRMLALSGLGPSLSAFCI